MISQKTRPRNHWYTILAVIGPRSADLFFGENPALWPPPAPKGAAAGANV